MTLIPRMKMIEAASDNLKGGKMRRTVADEIPTKARLGCIRAVAWAFFGVSADFYPRVIEQGSIKSLNSGEIFQEIGKPSDWDELSDGGLDDALALAKQSMAEVKAQTEYQDSKATRILTVTTFLTAFSGVLFTRFQDNYPLTDIPKFWIYHQYLIEAAYTAFCVMILFVLAGSLVIFHAIRTRFKYPDTHLAAKQELDPKSLEFYAALIAVRPRAWMKAWVETTAATPTGSPTTKIRGDLKSRYFHNLVGETYLIAAKTADKLRYLEPGQVMLAGSLRLLFIWLLLMMGVTIWVVPIKKVSDTTNVRLVDFKYSDQSWQHPLEANSVDGQPIATHKVPGHRP